jgi:23S rRNA G2069 N7-methylase RlmK/C1962 C5-methylase RlmI
MRDKDLLQAEYFRNRVAKNEKNLRRWARREGAGAYRLYDRDIPEIPLSLDLYLPAEEGSGGPRLCLALYDRPYDKDEAEEAAWLDLMARAAGAVIGVEAASIFLKTRKRMRGLEQYEKLGAGASELVVREAGLSFIVNLSDYLDTGLFLDHRPLRARVRAEAGGKRVLNLFSYTGSFSVYAAAGGAKEVTSVDLSKTYLDWAERNLALNGFGRDRHPLVREEARSFIAQAKRRGGSWDIIVLDPPTFSNSKASPEDFDVNAGWPGLVSSCVEILSPGGVLYFSTNSRKLRWDPSLIAASSEDITASTIPPDFHDHKVHRAWRIIG